MKKVLSLLLPFLLLGSIVGAYTAEQQKQGYERAKKNGITTQTLTNANLNGYVTRQAFSKMMVVFSDMIGNTITTNNTCNFADKNTITDDLVQYVEKACKLGIMGVNVINFNPMNYVSQAHFATVLSRLMWGSTFDGGTPYYTKHINALKNNFIIEDDGSNASSYKKRGDIMYSLMKAYNLLQGIIPFEETDEEIIFATYD